ncbi:MAG: hypothetical protein MK188_12350 [Gammaproteobacteria bacterium]|nr:hypothetical protein [Gammaproteobacteria bacterium]
MFTFQKTHIQGIEAPYRSHSTVKLCNAEGEFSERNSYGAELRALWICIIRNMWGTTTHN